MLVTCIVTVKFYNSVPIVKIVITMYTLLELVMFVSNLGEGFKIAADHVCDFADQPGAVNQHECQGRQAKSTAIGIMVMNVVLFSCLWACNSFLIAHQLVCDSDGEIHSEGATVIDLESQDSIEVEMDELPAYDPIKLPAY